MFHLLLFKYLYVKMLTLTHISTLVSGLCVTNSPAGQGKTATLSFFCMSSITLVYSLSSQTQSTAYSDTRKIRKFTSIAKKLQQILPLVSYLK